MPSLSFSANVVWYPFGKSERMGVLILVFGYLMYNALVVESGCEGPFHSTECFLSVIYFSINHFSLSHSIFFISFYLYLFLCCSFLSLRDPRMTELIQMRLSVGGCRSFPASFSCEGRKELFSQPSSHASRLQAWKCTCMYLQCVYARVHTHVYM